MNKSQIDAADNSPNDNFRYISNVIVIIMTVYEAIDLDNSFKIK